MELTELILTPVASAGIKTINTGYVSLLNTGLVAGSGEDELYMDITIPTVDTAKSLPFVVGGLGFNVNSGFSSAYFGNRPMVKFALQGSSAAIGSVSYWLACRLINPTTLRVSTYGLPSSGSYNYYNITFRWTVLESN